MPRTQPTLSGRNRCYLYTLDCSSLRCPAQPPVCLALPQHLPWLTPVPTMPNPNYWSPVLWPCLCLGTRPPLPLLSPPKSGGAYCDKGQRPTSTQAFVAACLSSLEWPTQNCAMIPLPLPAPAPAPAPAPPPLPPPVTGALHKPYITAAMMCLIV